MKKRIISVFICFLVLLLMLPSVTLSVSAASDFEVEDGVLLSYSGKSKSITIPADVSFIADSVFENNSTLESVNLNNVSVIGNKAFYGCTSLKTVTGDDNVSSCGAYAFFDTPFGQNYAGSALIIGSVLVSSKASGSYTVPSSVKSIAPYAFVSNQGITSVAMGDTVSSIGEGAFYDCSALKSVTVSPSVSYIGPFAFEGTKYLSSVRDEFLVLGNGILVDVNTNASEVKIPEGVKQLVGGLFYRNTNLVTVDIPDTVTAIGMRAFIGCTSLKSAQLPSKLVLLDKEAFYNCTSLKSVVIPKSVEIMGDSVFLGCTSLATVENYSSAPISSGLFAGCTSLKYVKNASKTEYVGSYAFYNCSSLAEVSMPDTVSFIHRTSFEGCNKLSVHCYLKSYAGEYIKNKGIKVYEIGDANNDRTLNIKDATHIQKATAGLVTLDFVSGLKADADFSGQINVRDATHIQKKIAGII